MQWQHFSCIKFCFIVTWLYCTYKPEDQIPSFFIILQRDNGVNTVWTSSFNGRHLFCSMGTYCSLSRFTQRWKWKLQNFHSSYIMKLTLKQQEAVTVTLPLQTYVLPLTQGDKPSTKINYRYEVTNFSLHQPSMGRKTNCDGLYKNKTWWHYNQDMSPLIT